MKDEPRTQVITLEVDADDYRDINKAIARRQLFRKVMGNRTPLPPGEGNMAGRYIGEICRGWMEMLDMARDDEDSE